MASRNVSTTYIQQTPQVYAATKVPPVSTAAVTVTTTYISIDSPNTDVE